MKEWSGQYHQAVDDDHLAHVVMAAWHCLSFGTTQSDGVTDVEEKRDGMLKRANDEYAKQRYFLGKM